MEDKKLSQLKKLEEHFKERLNILLKNRKFKVGEINGLKESVKEKEVTVKLIDTEIRDILFQTGKTEEPVYQEGFRMAFVPEIIGKIQPGKEIDFLNWCKESKNEDLFRLDIGKTALNKALDNNIQMPDCVSIDTYEKFKITKDTRKK